jgi:L-Ala-D/L-Glu epimerase
VQLVRYRLHALRLPYSRAVRWSDVVEDAATFLMLRLESDSGFIGVSEITVKPTWMGHGLRSLVASLQEVLLPRLASCDVLHAGAVQARLDVIPEQHAGKALIDNAVWDLRGAAAGQPLWRRWQGRESVPVSFTVTRQAPLMMAAEAVEWVERHGLRTLKIKGGQGRDQDIQVLRALRRAVGDDITFYVDANGAYSIEEAADYARAMHDFGARVVEDPCNFAPNARFGALQAAVPCPLLVDFPCTSLRDAALFIAAGARAFSLKPGRFGLTMTAALLAMAEEAGALTVVGMFGESALGTWHALALASRQPASALPAEVTWYQTMSQQVTHTAPVLRAGELRLHEEPSVASLVDWDRVRHLSFFDADGSI